RLTAPAPREILGARLLRPGRRVRVVFGNAMIELTRDAADGRLVADVRGAQPAGRQAPQKAPGLGDADALAHARGLDRRRPTPARRSDDANVALDDLAAPEWPRTKQRDEANPEPMRAEKGRNTPASLGTGSPTTGGLHSAHEHDGAASRSEV